MHGGGERSESAGTAPSVPRAQAGPGSQDAAQATGNDRATRLFLCGDLMSGRGIDQILAEPSGPRLFEPFVRSAVEYVRLAEAAAGPLPRHVADDYIWGAALQALERFHPRVRIVNLETAVTRSAEPDADKQIHYRMHPANIGCLRAGRIDCCVLSNNHVLDWGRSGLEETLQTLHGAGIATAGAGGDARAAAEPAIVALPGVARLLVYGVAVASSGVPQAWQAAENRPGVNWLASPSTDGAERIARRIASDRRATDRVIVSIHWGGNWGYRVTREERAFAHWLIDHGGVDLVHGHSSHHPKGLEVYRGKLILYGCGDLLNDYEGIGRYERFRPDLALMYLPQLDERTGGLHSLELVPMRIHRLQLEEGSAQDADWLAETLDRESRGWGARVRSDGKGILTVAW